MSFFFEEQDSLDVVLRLLPSRPAPGTDERDRFNSELNDCASWEAMEEYLVANHGAEFVGFEDACSEIYGDEDNSSSWNLLDRGFALLAPRRIPSNYTYPRSKPLSLVIK